MIPRCDTIRAVGREEETPREIQPSPPPFFALAVPEFAITTPGGGRNYDRVGGMTGVASPRSPLVPPCRSFLATFSWPLLNYCETIVLSYDRA